jgi:photosystem II biogenesis protein Psp29
MDKIRTVSDTKRKFYQYHTRPVNSIYRRIVEELMVEMHLLAVNVNFKADPCYYLGVVTSFDRFMAGYSPEKDKDSIFNALCQSVDGNPQEYRRQGQALLALAKQKSPEELINWLSSPTKEDGVEEILDSLKHIHENTNFKYSRLFAIGLYTLITESDPQLLKDDKKRQETLQKLAKSFNLPVEKMQKDLDLYRSNLEKMTQMLSVLQETLEASRKKKEKKENKPEPETT